MAQQRNLILIGPMGAGKSTIGRQVSSLLHYEFVDSDHEIEQRSGADIPWIFDVEGEEGFRRRESAMIAELTQRSHIVLATGGGAVVKEELAEVTNIVDVPDAAANVDTGATFNMALATLGKSGSVSFPMPDPVIVNADGTVDLTNGLVTAWTLQYTNGDILISDGEVVTAINSGMLDK